MNTTIEAHGLQDAFLCKSAFDGRFDQESQTTQKDKIEC